MTMNDIGLIEFIKVFKENRCLWDPRDVSYTNRAVRKAAQMALVNVFQKYDSNANLANVRRKIDNIRAAYMRERRKVQAREIEGLSNEVYVPTLWYYDHLHFLSEMYDEVTKANSPDPLCQPFLEDDEEEKCEACQQDDVTDFRTPAFKVLKRKRLSAQKKLTTATEKLTNRSETGLMDTWEAFGFSVGGDLRNLGRKQQTIAQKLISDVIFYAKMGQLSEGSAVYDTHARLRSSSPSASSIMSPTHPPCTVSRPLSPCHDVSASLQPPIPEPSKYSLLKENGPETKSYFSSQQMSANDPSETPTTQQKPENATLPQDM